MLRKIFAVVGGIVVMNLIIFLIESIEHLMYPLPKGMDYKDKEAFAKYVESLPITAMLIIVFGYAFGAFAAGFVSTRIAKDGKKIYALICGIFLLAAIIFNFMMIPTPIWMWVLGVLTPLLVFAGHKVALKNIKI